MKGMSSEHKSMVRICYLIPKGRLRVGVEDDACGGGSDGNCDDNG